MTNDELREKLEAMNTLAMEIAGQLQRVLETGGRDDASVRFLYLEDALDNIDVLHKRSNEHGGVQTADQIDWDSGLMRELR